MPTPVFYLKVGDRLPSIEATLLDFSGQAVNLTGATVEWVYRKLGAATGLVRSAAVVNAAQGKVRYDWVAEDTIEPGLLDAEWRVTFADGRKMSFPNHRHLRLQIVSNLVD